MTLLLTKSFLLYAIDKTSVEVPEGCTIITLHSAYLRDSYHGQSQGLTDTLCQFQVLGISLTLQNSQAS